MLMRIWTVIRYMIRDSFRAYVYIKKVNESKRDAVRNSIAEHDIDVYYKYDFDGETTYISEPFIDSTRTRELIDDLESDIRDQFDDRAVKRDERNTSPGAPGIDGVSYVTGIIIGFSD